MTITDDQKRALIDEFERWERKVDSEQFVLLGGHGWMQDKRLFVWTYYGNPITDGHEPTSAGRHLAEAYRENETHKSDAVSAWAEVARLRLKREAPEEWTPIEECGELEPWISYVVADTNLTGFGPLLVTRTESGAFWSDEIDGVFEVDERTHILTRNGNPVRVPEVK